MFLPVRSVHFVGIGGTAMASAAVAMKEKGFEVTGSDQNVYPPMSTFLAERKIPVMNGYAEQNLAHKPDLVVIGNAISRGNPEAEFVLDHKLRYCSLPEASGTVEGILHSRQAFHCGCRDTWENHHDFAADLGVRAQWLEPQLPDRRHSE
jgi:hypothetical protein